MAMTVSELQVKVSADTSAAESGLSSLGTKIGSVGGTLATAFGAAAIGGIAAIGAGLTASVAAASNFESAMSAIKAVSGATGAEMEQLSGLALQLGADTSFSASEAAAGIEELAKAGVSVADIMGGGARAALDLAAAGGLGVAEAATIASDSLNMFNLKGSDAAHAADMLAGASVASSADVHGLGQGLAAVGAVAHAFGLTLDDTVTSLAVMAQAGVKGSDAGTSLKTMLLNLTPTTKAQIAVAKELGIVTADGANKFFDQSGKVKSAAEIAGVLQTATADLTEQQKAMAFQTLFGTDAIRAAVIMSNAGTEGFNKMAAAETAAGGAHEIAKTRLDNLKGSLEQLKGSLETAGIQLGTLLLPGLRSMVDGATIWVNKAIDIIKELPDAWETVKQAFEGDWSPSDTLTPFMNTVGTMATQFKGTATIISDSWGTIKQALSGDWSPSDQIDPFVNDVGKATLTIKGMNTEIDRLKESATGLGNAISILNGQLGGTAEPINLLARAARLLVVDVGAVIDLFISLGRVALDLVSMVVSVARALGDLAKGDLPAATAALKDGDKAFADMMTTAGEFATRTVARTQESFDLIAGSATEGMTATAAAVETNMSAANAAVAEGSAGWRQSMEANGAATQVAAETAMTGVATATETGMATSVAAVETQGAAAVVAAEAMGTGMTAGIESAAPAMAAAAEAGATGAVAAVQGQTGAASGAGQSLGEALGSGMEGGIGAYVGRVAAAAGRLVSAAIGAARSEAQAESPSKKTEKLGKDLAAGLEIGLNSSKLGPAMIAQIRDFIQASRDYIPTAGEIKRVEQEIADIRYQSQVAGLFRLKEMIVIDSEVLRLKAAQAVLERDAIGLRHELAAADRELADIQRGSLADRTRLIELDGEQAKIRLYSIGLQRELLDLTQMQVAHALKVSAAERDLGELRARYQVDEIERGRDIADLDERALRLRQAMAIAERDLLPIRQKLAAAARDVADIERGSLRSQKESIIQDGQRAEIRLQEIGLEKQLLLLAADDPRAEAIKKQLEALQAQDRMLGLEAERIRTVNEIAAIGARLKEAALDEQVRRQEKNNQKTKDQSELLDAQRGIFSANEAIIKAAQERDLRSREALISAIKLEGRATEERVKAIEQQIQKLDTQNKAMQLEADWIKTSNDIAAVGSRIRREGLDDQVRGYDTLIGAITRQITALGLERGVFDANEAVIKNATENEVHYRERLIAVFTAEGKPLADRVTAGLALVEQLHKEGKISDELYTSIKNAASAAGVATTATSGLGTAASIAAPQLDTAAKKAAAMAAETRALAELAGRAAGQVSALASSLGKLPSWFKPTGSSGGQNILGFGSGFGSSSGSQSVGGNQAPAVVPQAFTGSSSTAPMQTVRVDVAIGGRVAEEIYVTGRDLAIRRGRVPAGSS